MSHLKSSIVYKTRKYKKVCVTENMIPQTGGPISPEIINLELYDAQFDLTFHLDSIQLNIKPYNQQNKLSLINFNVGQKR